MSQRRMFSPEIVESDAFLDMPISSQALYFHLGMYADDDGFVNPKKIMRMTTTSDDDLKILIGKRFLLGFPSGVVVVKHWKINNLVRKDWYRPTQYLEEKGLLQLKENGSYTEKLNLVNEPSTQVRLGKDRLGKVNTTVAHATSISINHETMTLDEITYEPLEGSKSKTKYGRKTMMLLARCYLETAGIVLEAGENYDANKISKSLSKLLKECGGDADKVMERIKTAGQYFNERGLTWTPEAVWRNWETIQQKKSIPKQSLL